MPKRSSRPDLNQIAARIVDESTRHPEKNPAAVALGRLGGLKGGKARDLSLSKRRKSQIAKKAALARWKRAKNR
jgi:hypothetical protein